MDNLARQQETQSQYTIQSAQVKKKLVYLVCKRIFDVVFSAIALVVLFVPMLVLAAVIKLDSPGPVIFKQKRMGRCGKVFLIYKFRTLGCDAPSEMATRELEHLELFTTKVGRILRKTSIDELPQLINIFLGHMSFIGYRPVCLTETTLNVLRMEHGVFALRPGLTGYAQVCGRDDISLEDKIMLDIEYTQKCGLKMDIYCLYKTIQVVLSGKGAV